MAPKVKAKAKAKAKAVGQAPPNVIQLNAQQLHAQHRGLLEAPPYSQCTGDIHGNLSRERLGHRDLTWDRLVWVWELFFISLDVLQCMLSFVSRALDVGLDTYVRTCGTV